MISSNVAYSAVHGIKVKASLKEKRWRIALAPEDLVRLASFLDVISSELPLYQQKLTQAYQQNKLRDQQPARQLTCLKTLLPKLEKISRSEEALKAEDGEIFYLLTTEELLDIRTINYCARHLLDLGTAISWLEFSQALAPILAAIDASVFRQLANLIIPKPVSCTVDDFKRGQTLAENFDNEEEIDGLDWNT